MSDENSELNFAAIMQAFHRMSVDLEERDKQWQIAFAAIQWKLAEKFPEHFKDENGKPRNLVEEFIHAVYPHLVANQNVEPQLVFTEPTNG